MSWRHLERGVRTACRVSARGAYLLFTTWSPDGSRVLIEIRDGGQADLAQRERRHTDRAGRGSACRRLSRRDLTGRKTGGVRRRQSLAHQQQNRTSESGREIHVIGSDGRGERVLSSVGSDLYPVGWTSDGRAALIVSSRSNTTGLWAFPVSNGVDGDEPRLIERDCERRADRQRVGRSFLGHRNDSSRGSVFSDGNNAQRYLHGPPRSGEREGDLGGDASQHIAEGVQRSADLVAGRETPPVLLEDAEVVNELSMFTLEDGVERRFRAWPSTRAGCAG